MNTTRLLELTLACLLLTGAAHFVRAAEVPAGQEKRPTREDWQKMTPEQREAKMKELREKRQVLTPEQREAQRKVWRERMDKRIEELKKKKADGTITTQEEQVLKRMEEMVKRWDQVGSPQTPRTTPAKPADKPAEKPAEQPATPVAPK